MDHNHSMMFRLGYIAAQVPWWVYVWVGTLVLLTISILTQQSFWYVTAMAFSIPVGWLTVMYTYLLPYTIASKRRHHNTGAIFVMNLFLGWTFLGWVLALVWAHTKSQEYARVVS